MENLDRSIRFEPADREPLFDQLPPVSPNDPPWNSPMAFGVWLGSVLAIVLFPMLFLIPYVVTQNGPAVSGQELGTFLQQDPTALLLQVAAIFPAHAVTLLMAWLVVTWGRNYSFTKTLGWASGGVAWWHYALFMFGFFALAGVLSYWVPEPDNEFLRLLKSSRAALVLVAIMATFTAPIAEEVIYRGIMYSAFQRTFGSGLAIVIVTVLFAAVHVPQYYPSYATMFLLTILSLTLTLIRARSGNLLPCIILHTIFNGAQSILFLLEPSLEKATENAPAFLHFLFK